MKFVIVLITAVHSLLRFCTSIISVHLVPIWRNEVEYISTVISNPIELAITLKLNPNP